MFDPRINEIFQKINSPLLNEIMNGISFFGSFYIVLIFGYLLFFLKGKKEVFNFFITLFFSYLFVFLTKQAFMIKRPFTTPGVLKLSYEDFNPLSYSFISGHSMIASLIPTYLIINSKKKLFALMYLYSLVVMFSRIYLGVHYYIDTLAGFLVGVFIPIYYKRIIKLFKYKNEFFLIPFLLGVIYLIYQSSKIYHAKTIFNISLLTLFFLGLYLSSYYEIRSIKIQYISFLIMIIYALIIISRYLLALNILINGDNFIYLVIISLIINLYALLCLPNIIFKMEALYEKVNRQRIKNALD